MNEELSKLIALLEEPEFHGFNTRRYNENIQLILKSVIGTQLEVIYFTTLMTAILENKTPYIVKCKIRS